MNIKRPFTLLELIIVIAIIGILTTILLPSLRGAKEKSKIAVCMSNLNSINTAMTLFCQDNNGRLPDSLAYNIIGKEGNIASAWGGFTRQADRPLNVYVNNAVEVAHCPSDKGDYLLPGNDGRDNFSTVGSSYMYAYYSSSASYKYGIEHVKNKFISRLNPPDKKIVIGDGIFYGNRLFSNPQTKWHSKTKRQMNILFADGHVEFFNFPLAIEGWGGIPIDPDRGWW